MNLSDEDVLRDFDQDETTAENGDLVLPVKPEIAYHGKSYSKITLREPTFSDVIRSAQEAEKTGGSVSFDTFLYDYEVCLVKHCSDVPIEVIDNLRADYETKARDIVGQFEITAQEQAKNLQSSDWVDYPDDYTIPLEQPIEGGGQTYHELVITAPKIKHVRDAKRLLKNEKSFVQLLKYDQLLIERCSGWTRAATLKLPISKKTIASGYIDYFLQPGR